MPNALGEASKEMSKDGKPPSLPWWAGGVDTEAAGARGLETRVKGREVKVFDPDSSNPDEPEFRVYQESDGSVWFSDMFKGRGHNDNARTSPIGVAFKAWLAKAKGRSKLGKAGMKKQMAEALSSAVESVRGPDSMDAHLGYLRRTAKGTAYEKSPWFSRLSDAYQVGDSDEFHSLVSRWRDELEPAKR